MQVDQGKIFAESEGDRWFERNRDSLQGCDPQRDLPLRLMEMYSLRPRCVLEIGAANGYRLAVIAGRCGAKTVAVEPSSSAIRDGRSRFSDVRFVQATADAVPLAESFDLVIVNFVLHWVDRDRLLRVVAELDRLLTDGGFLIIGDFCPDQPMRVRYHHLNEQDVYTYKQDYAATFLASGLYRQVACLTGHHSGQALEGYVCPNDRIAAWLLQKGLEERYLDGSFKPD